MDLPARGWVSCLGVLSVLTASCSLAFDDFDPRLGGGSSTTTSVTGTTTSGEGGTGAGGMGAGGDGGDGGDGGMGGADPIVHCNELRKLAQAPVIDGVIEPGMYLESVDPVGWRVCNNCSQTFPVGHSTRYAAAWFDEGIYWFLEVTDPDRYPANIGDELWMGDAVELYVDHDATFAPAGSYDDPGTVQFIIAAPPSDDTDSSRAARHRTAGPLGNWTSSAWIAKPTTTGYVVEAAVRAADLDLSSWTPAAGQTVGIDLSHDVSLPVGQTGSDGNRLGQYFLAIGPAPLTNEDFPFFNSGVFCTPELLP